MLRPGASGKTSSLTQRLSIKRKVMGDDPVLKTVLSSSLRPHSPWSCLAHRRVREQHCLDYVPMTGLASCPRPSQKWRGQLIHKQPWHLMTVSLMRSVYAYQQCLMGKSISQLNVASVIRKVKIHGGPALFIKDLNQVLKLLFYFADKVE